MNSAETFLRALFLHPDLAGLYFCLWTKQDKRSDYYPCADGQAIADAAGVAVALGWAKDVYVGCCPYTEAGPENGRGTAEKAGALVAQWLDIDVAGPGHAAKNLPATKAEAVAFINSAVRPASMVIDSGGGIHAWWVGTRPFLIRDAADRAMAAAASIVWGKNAISAGELRGWKVDRVSDLARVLRIPGTMNHKTSPPAPVEFIPGEDPASADIRAS